jgi:hypothetical protein
LIELPHFGQAEFGKTIDCRLGTRWITTLRKLPTAAPNINTKKYITPSGTPVMLSNESVNIIDQIGNQKSWIAVHLCKK